MSNTASYMGAQSGRTLVDEERFIGRLTIAVFKFVLCPVLVAVLIKVVLNHLAL